jgi:hypothetical protein
MALEMFCMVRSLFKRGGAYQQARTNWLCATERAALVRPFLSVPHGITVAEFNVFLLIFGSFNATLHR